MGKRNLPRIAVHSMALTLSTLFFIFLARMSWETTKRGEFTGIIETLATLSFLPIYFLVLNLFKVGFLKALLIYLGVSLAAGVLFASYGLLAYSPSQGGFDFLLGLIRIIFTYGLLWPLIPLFLLS